MKNIAIILSGCGNRDGSELQETLSLFLAIDRRNWRYQCFAPMGDYAVISHLDGRPSGEVREIIAESARLSRGDIRDLDEYRPEDYDALLLPGGMGAARNLSTYAISGEKMRVMPNVEQAILATHRAGRPIGAMCIAPMVLSKVLGPLGVTLTLGPDDNDASAVARALGARTQACGPTDICIDESHRVVTTPAYMAASHISEIFAGGENLVSQLGIWLQ